MKKKYILSISFCYHDSSITFSDDKSILLHLEWERISRKKHDRFRNLSEVDFLVKIGLENLNISINDITKVYVTKWNNLYRGNDIVILGRRFKAILTSHHQNHIGTCFPSGFNRWFFSKLVESGQSV